MNDKNRELMKNLLIMRWYPIIQVICSIPATIHRVFNLITGNDNFVLGILQGIFDSIVGFLICITFLLSPEIKKNFITCFRKIFRKKNVENIDEAFHDSVDSTTIERDDYDNKDFSSFYMPPSTNNNNINNKNTKSISN